jgi:hypothetical protein
MKGIIFKEEMFRRVIDGTKTQTRRLIKIPNDATLIGKGITGYTTFEYIDRLTLDMKGRKELMIQGIYPRYDNREIVYLKEPYHLICKYPNALEEPNCSEYVAEYAFDKANHIRLLKIWKNKLLMPERYARYFIKITDIWVQRLNQITPADAVREGFESIAQFQNTWITIHGWSSLKANPWVWVYEFELTTK